MWHIFTKPSLWNQVENLCQGGTFLRLKPKPGGSIGRLDVAWMGHKNADRFTRAEARRSVSPTVPHAESRATVGSSSLARCFLQEILLGQGPSCWPWSLLCGGNAPGWRCSTRSAGWAPYSWITNTEHSQLWAHWLSFSISVISPGLLKRSEPDSSRPLPQVVAKLQDPIVQRQRDEISLSVRFLAVVEDQTVGIVGHENHRHADFLTEGKAQKKKKLNTRIF